MLLKKFLVYWFLLILAAHLFFFIFHAFRFVAEIAFRLFTLFVTVCRVFKRFNVWCQIASCCLRSCSLFANKTAILVVLFHQDLIIEYLYFRLKLQLSVSLKC